jgi:hypothetical protein
MPNALLTGVGPAAALRPVSPLGSPRTAGISRWMTDEIRASGIAQQPTGRLGTPNNTANLVRSCSPSKASGLTDNSCTATAATQKACSPSDHRHPARSRMSWPGTDDSKLHRGPAVAARGRQRAVGDLRPVWPVR